MNADYDGLAQKILDIARENDAIARDALENGTNAAEEAAERAGAESEAERRAAQRAYAAGLTAVVFQLKAALGLDKLAPLPERVGSTPPVDAVQGRPCSTQPCPKRHIHDRQRGSR